MVKLALFVRLEAKPGKEKEVENFLLSGLPLVQAEPATTAWFGIRLGPSTLAFLTRFQMKLGGKLIFPVKSQPRLWKKRGSYSPSRRQSKRLTFLRQSCQAKQPQ